MELLLLIPALLVFFYLLYKLTGDDHVFIRKNISVEQMFDIAFATLWISIVVSRILYFVMNPGKGNVVINFFSTAGGLSFPGAVAGGIVALYLIGKLKKVPLGRLFDFFTLSLLFALPVGYLILTLFQLNKPAMIPYLIFSVVYLAAAIVFRRWLFPKLLNRTLKEGTIAILFFLIYSSTSYALTFLDFGKKTFTIITIPNFIYLGIFLLSIILLIKQERNKLRRRA